VRQARLTYPLSIAALLAALLLRWLLDGVLGDALPLVTLFGAVATAAWLGGRGPAIVVTVLGYLASNFLFMQPRGVVVLDDPGNLVGLLAYLFTSTLIIGFGEAMRLAQRAANERREVLQVTLRSIGDAVITTDTDGNITSLNGVAESLTGWDQRDALGLPLREVFRIVNETTRRPVADPVRKALRDGVIVGLANRTVLIRKDGGEIAIDDSAAPISDERGRVSGCVLIFRDVSAQRLVDKDKAAQLMTARLLAAIVESSDDAIISKSLEGVIQSWNAAAERIFGYAADEAVGKHISLVIPPERIGEEDDIIASLKAGRRIDHFETERVRKDGQIIQVSLTISPIKDDTGKVIGASKIVRDVTKQRQIEARERRERERAEAERETFVRVIESSTDFIGMWDMNGIPFFVNRAGLEMTGLESIEKARATPVRDFFFPEDQDRIIDEFFPEVLARGHGEIEVRFRNFKTGEARWMAYKVLTLTDASGTATGLATVSQDVTERKRLADDLRRLAADLEEAGQRKDEFLAMLAHELRNPLAAISNTMRILKPGGDGSGAAAAMLERQVGQMARLVDDLLDVSRITRGKIELRRELVDLEPLVRQAVEAARPLFQRLGQELEVELPAEPIHLDADATRIAQIVGNLLSNAAKFTDKGGRIALAVSREGHEAVVRVRDTGIGIAAEQRTRVFEMFTQVDTSLERSRDGLGIGLTLVKTLVDMHGGTVEVHSEGLGHGSEFIVRLPVAKERPTSVAVAPKADAEPVAGRRILIVDDNEDGAESLAMLLALDGHETRTVHDGLEALKAAEEFRPHTVLLDIGLPKLNGYEVCRRLRSEPWGKDLVLVALTGWGQVEDRQRSRDAGFDAHIVKPIDHSALRKLLAASHAAAQEHMPGGA
jgi:PAS domain S-box-containing protein